MSRKDEKETMQALELATEALIHVSGARIDRDQLRDRGTDLRRALRALCDAVDQYASSVVYPHTQLLEAAAEGRRVVDRRESTSPYKPDDLNMEKFELGGRPLRSLVASTTGRIVATFDGGGQEYVLREGDDA